MQTYGSGTADLIQFEPYTVLLLQNLKTLLSANSSFAPLSSCVVAYGHPLDERMVHLTENIYGELPTQNPVACSHNSIVAHHIRLHLHLQHVTEQGQRVPSLLSFLATADAGI